MELCNCSNIYFLPYFLLIQGHWWQKDHTSWGIANCRTRAAFTLLYPLGNLWVCSGRGPLVGTAGAIDHLCTFPGAISWWRWDSHLSSQEIEEERDVTLLSKCNSLQKVQKCRLLTWFSQLVSWMSTVRSLLATQVTIMRWWQCKVEGAAGLSAGLRVYRCLGLSVVGSQGLQVPGASGLFG